MEYECPVCGVLVDQNATECPACGEVFAVDDVDQNQDVQDIQEVPPEEAGESEEPPEETNDVTSPEDISETCPLCGGNRYSPESGDLVSCLDCGNVYTKQFPAGGTENSWKWKFWIGLVFILIGDFGFALASYLHNVYRWSPLGDLYLGYGWMDSLLGAVGVIIFIIGLILFAWSFKRERVVQCPNCKVHMLESDLLPPPEDEEDEVTLEGVIEDLEEEVLECPNCGASTGIFDKECPSCGVPFEVVEDVVEMDEHAEVFTEDDVQLSDGPVIEESVVGEELIEEQVIMESLEYKEEQDEIEDNGTMALLDEMESELELDEDGHTECPGCGTIIDGNDPECPICGEQINGGG